MHRPALARTYRPRKFQQIVGQNHVSSTLRRAVESGRVGHAYLFCGPRGIGKTTAARVLAMALNCSEQREGEPCGECESCERIWAGRTVLDVVEIDAASNRGVEDARDLRERAMYAPSDEDRYKVYIIDEAHMITPTAWNALLKLLEEPPPRVVFAFATTEPQKIQQSAAPILSRCQRFDFHRVSVADIRSRLRDVLAEEGVEADEEALLIIARRAEGGVRDALSMLDQVLSFTGDNVSSADVRAMLGWVGEDRYVELMEILFAHDRGGVFPYVQRLLDEGRDLGEFLRGLGDLLRVLLQLRLDPESAVAELSPGSRERLTAVARRREELDLLRMLVAVGDFESEGRLRRSERPRIQVEVLLLRLASMDSSVGLRELMEAAGGEPSSPAPVPTPPPTQSGSASSAADSASVESSSMASESGSMASKVDPPTPAAAQVAVGRRVSTARVGGTTALRDAWRAALASASGLGGVAMVLGGAGVARGAEDEIVVRVPTGLEEDLRAFLGDRGKSASFRAELGRNLSLSAERLGFRVEGSGVPQRLTAATTREQRLATLVEADPRLRNLVDALDLELKE